MTGDEIPDDDLVVRHLRAGLIDGDRVVSRAFCDDFDKVGWDEDRLGSIHPSVNWLDYYPGEVDAQLAAVRYTRRRDYGGNSRFAVLRVSSVVESGQVGAAEHAEPCPIKVIHVPEEPDEDHPRANPSHAEIHDLPSHDKCRMLAISRYLVRRIIEPLRKAKGPETPPPTEKE